MWQKIELYIVSLIFLFVLLFINKIDVPVCFANCKFVGLKPLLSSNIVPIFSIVFIILGIAFYLRFKYKFVKASGRLPWQIRRIESINFETLSFLSTYIIPLLCFDLDFNLDEKRNTTMFFLVLILIGAIYVKTNIFYTNPTLALLGYHIYKIDTQQRQNIIVISKTKLNVNDWVRYKHISDNIYFVKP